jgi:hypothetical protein
MRATAVPENHLMCSEFCVASHRDCSDNIHLDRKRLPYYQDDVSIIAKQVYGVGQVSKDVSTSKLSREPQARL